MGGRRVSRNSESFRIERSEEEQDAFTQAQQEQEDAAANREPREGTQLGFGGLRELIGQQDDSEAALQGEGPARQDVEEAEEEAAEDGEES